MEKFEKQLDAFDRKMKSLGNGMKSAGSAMTKYMTAPITAGFALVTKGTEEFRGDLSKLENNARLAGAGMQDLHDQMGFLNAVTGETDSNIEALSNLLQAGFKNNSLAEAVELLSGAVLKFPDTLKIESLADSLQETIATKQATGQFAELLGRLGIETDKFTDGLKRAARQGQETKYVLEALGRTDLSSATKSFENNNKALIESQKSAYEMQVAFAKAGDRLMPIVTKITNGITTVLDAFNGLDEGTQNFILTIGAVAAAAGPVVSLTGNLVLGLGALSMALGKGTLSATANAAAVSAAGTAAAGAGASAATAAGGVRAFNLSLSACPAVMIVGGLIAVGAAIAAIVISAQEANPELKKLNGELKEQQETADKLAKEREKAIQGSIGEADHLKALREELKSYVDENGNVLESKGRVKYIVDEINKAMPDTIKWIDSETLAYQKTEKAIDALISKKRAQILLDALGPEYENAVLNVKKVQNEQAALGVKISEKQLELDKIMAEQEGEAGQERLKQMQALRSEIDELSKKKQESMIAADMFHGNTGALDESREYRRQIDERKAKLKELLDLQGQQDKQVKQLTQELQKLSDAQQKCDNTADGYLRIIKTVEMLDEAVATSNTKAINSIVDNCLNASSTIKMSVEDYVKFTQQQYKDAQKDFEKGLITEGALDAARRRAEGVQKEAEASGWKSGAEVGKQVVAGVAQGITENKKTAFDAVVSMANEAVAEAQKALGIHSPSRVFADKVGKYLPLGMAAGYKEAMPEAMRQIQSSFDQITASMQAAAVAPPAAAGVTNISNTSHSSPVYNVTIDARNVREFNDIVRLAENARQGGRIR